MFTFFIVVLLIGYGLNKLAQFIKNNPSQSMEATEWLKRLFGR
jgi:hypothetical protein